MGQTYRTNFFFILKRSNTIISCLVYFYTVGRGIKRLKYISFFLVNKKGSLIPLSIGRQDIIPWIVRIIFLCIGLGYYVFSSLNEAVFLSATETPETTIIKGDFYMTFTGLDIMKKYYETHVRPPFSFSLFPRVLYEESSKILGFFFVHLLV